MSDHNNDDGHSHQPGPQESPLALGVEAAGHVFLELRAQNVDLLRLAAEVAGYAVNHGPLKPNEVRQAMAAIWDVYSQFHLWVDPEEDAEEGDDEDEDEDA